MKTSAAALALLLAVPATISAQTSARDLLDSALHAHGGRAAIEASRLLLRYDGADVRRNQSAAVLPPYGREPATGEMYVDVPAAQFVVTYTFGYVGGFRNRNRIAIDSARGYSADLLQRIAAPQSISSLWTQRARLSYVPHLALLAALHDSATLQPAAEIQIDGRRFPAISTGPDGNRTFLLFDPQTHLLRSLVTQITDAVGGDAQQEIRFDRYQRSGPWMVPERRTVVTAGEVTSELSMKIDAVEPIPDSLLALPALDRPKPAPFDSVYEIGKGVWAVRASGFYYALAVEFADHVVVVEAPAGSSDVIRRVRTLLPQKPIRYVAITHHHTDHSVGIRDYVAEGIPVLTTTNNRAFIEKIARSTRTRSPDALARSPREPRIETFDKSRILTDGSRILELIDVGPNPHADEMVVAWVPDAGVMFQGDLLNISPDNVLYPNTATTASKHFADWLTRRGLNVRILVGTHMLPGPVDRLHRANDLWQP